MAWYPIETEKCTECKNKAKWVVKSWFGNHLKCGVHVRKYAKNFFCIVERI